MPNIPEAIVGFLAAAAIGAVWSLVPPEFGSRGTIMRLRQFRPDVLLAVDGYQYGDRFYDKREDVREICDELSSLKLVVTIPYLYPQSAGDRVTWHEMAYSDAREQYTYVSFQHPLYVLYSSGTTGRPKAIVHGHGGMTIDHLKQLRLHGDLTVGGKFYWHASTAWMVWNLGVSSLMCGASLLIYDGNSLYPTPAEFWRRVSREEVTYLGVAAAFIMQCRAKGIIPSEIADMSRLRTVVSGGSPLPQSGWEWIYGSVSSQVYLASESGGTELGGAVLGGTRLVPVKGGTIACRCLGAAVYAFDGEGCPVYDTQGEMVLTKPGPFMSLGLLDEHGDIVPHESYYRRFRDVWSQGDWLTISSDGRCVITGRSDATLNRGGVRLGTGEFYPVLESIAGVSDSLVVHLEDREGGSGQLVLFVQMAAGIQLDDSLLNRINSSLASQLSPRHVPDLTYQVPEIPRSLTGKKLEVPVKRILQGESPAKVADAAAPATWSVLAGFTKYRQPWNLVSRPE
jgi:acetoacetyl-CoA synthetase